MLMRPAMILALLFGLLLFMDALLIGNALERRRQWQAAGPLREITVAALGLTDLAVATEARYTRHPAVSDPLAPFMDHPGAIDHFPTGSFWAPPPPFQRVP